jgi:hypothetical protein
MENNLLKSIDIKMFDDNYIYNNLRFQKICIYNPKTYNTDTIDIYIFYDYDISSNKRKYLTQADFYDKLLNKNISIVLSLKKIFSDRNAWIYFKPYHRDNKEYDINSIFYIITTSASSVAFPKLTALNTFIPGFTSENLDPSYYHNIESSKYVLLNKDINNNLIDKVIYPEIISDIGSDRFSYIKLRDEINNENNKLEIKKKYENLKKYQNMHSFSKQSSIDEFIELMYVISTTFKKMISNESGGNHEANVNRNIAFNWVDMQYLLNNYMDKKYNLLDSNNKLNNVDNVFINFRGGSVPWINCKIKDYFGGNGWFKNLNELDCTGGMYQVLNLINKKVKIHDVYDFSYLNTHDKPFKISAQSYISNMDNIAHDKVLTDSHKLGLSFSDVAEPEINPSGRFPRNNPINNNTR